MNFSTPKATFVQFDPTFFSGQHFAKQYFDEGFVDYVIQDVRVPGTSDGHENDLFVDPFNIDELNAAIAKTSITMSFDTNGVHLSMIEKMHSKGTTLKTCFCNFSKTAGRLRHGPGKNLDMSSTASRSKETRRLLILRTLVHVPFPVTLVNSSNEFWPIKSTNPSTCTTSLVMRTKRLQNKKKY